MGIVATQLNLHEFLHKYPSIHFAKLSFVIRYLQR